MLCSRGHRLISFEMNHFINGTIGYFLQPRGIMEKIVAALSVPWTEGPGPLFWRLGHLSWLGRARPPEAHRNKETL